MAISKIFKRVLIPCAAGVKAGGPAEPDCSCNNQNEPKTRPSDLPIYSKCTDCYDGEVTQAPPSTMEEAVGNIRRELWVWQDNLKGYRHKVVDVYRNGFAKADYVVDYLREEAHGPQRIGAIGLSGLAGYILGMRRGFYRRILYGCCGAAGMAAICYPDETIDCLESVLLEARRYFIVTYHFVFGETPQMPAWLEKLTKSVPAAESSKPVAALPAPPPPSSPQESVKSDENSLRMVKLAEKALKKRD